MAKGGKCSMAIGSASGRYHDIEILIYILYRKLKQNFEFSALTSIYICIALKQPCIPQHTTCIEH